MVETLSSEADVAVPPADWKKTYSLCDQGGDRLLILETSSENTIPIAGSINGIAFELFRCQGSPSPCIELTSDDEMKKFIIRSHSLYTNTTRILDTIHACLLNNECGGHWQSDDAAALRYYREISPIDIVFLRLWRCGSIFSLKNLSQPCADNKSSI
jgi:hypothetical protein